MKEITAGIFVETRHAPYNLGVIMLADGMVLAVDAPPDPKHSQEWRQEIESQVGSLRYLVLSDASAEKLVAAALWRDVPLIISAEAHAALGGLIEDGWRELVQKIKLRYLDSALDSLKPPVPILIFSHDLQFHHRSSSLLLSVVPTFIPGALTVFDTQTGIFFAGDLVAITRPSPALATADYRAWAAYLDELSGRAEVRRIIPGRGAAPIFRAELEQQRELMRILQQTARKLIQDDSQLGARARDLGQIFFNRAGNQATKCLKQALEHLLAELTLPERDFISTEVESEEVTNA